MAIPKKNQAEEEQSPESQLSERYPDPAVEVLDPSFAKYRIFNAAVEHLASGMRWSEGPVWFGGGRFLLWSDLPNNRIMIHRAPFTSDRAKWNANKSIASAMRRGPILAVAGLRWRLRTSKCLLDNRRHS
jgi:sugar lactone lactonase YvrE